VCNSQDANILKCADVAVSQLTTAVSKLQRDVTELKTGVTDLTTYSQHSNATGNLSNMYYIDFCFNFNIPNSVCRPYILFKLLLGIF